MNRPEALRVAVVGCGYQGKALAQAVVRSDNLRLVACADPDPRRGSGSRPSTEDVSSHESFATCSRQLMSMRC